MHNRIIQNIDKNWYATELFKSCKDNGDESAHDEIAFIYSRQDYNR